MWDGKERRSAPSLKKIEHEVAIAVASLKKIEHEVACTVSAFHNFRRKEFVPLRNSVGVVTEVLDVVKFLKTGFKITTWITSAGAATALFTKTMGWW